MSELRKHYEAKDTEILMDIVKGDLTDIAKTTIRQVLMERGVDGETISAAQEQGVKEREDASAEDLILASLGKRFVAFLIDTFTAIIVAGIVGLVFKPAGVIIFYGYLLIRDSIPGQGVGKRFLNIKVVDEGSFRLCAWHQSLVRNLLHIFFFLDLLFLFSRKQKRLGDFAASTIVIDKKR